jgi:uncharacterized membrane protein YkoI
MIRVPFFWSLAFIAALGGGGIRTSAVAQEGTPVNLSDLPALAQKTIQTHLSGGKIEEILRVSESCQVLFDVEWTINHQSRSLTVNEQGVLMEIDIPLNTAPPAVKKTIHARAGKDKITAVTKCFNDGETSFEVEILRGGKERTLIFSASGQLEEEEIGLKEAPEKVRAAVQQASHGKVVEDIFKIMDDGETNFEVELGDDQQTHTITFDPQGQLVAEEQSVAASVLPPPVWKTYHEAAGTVSPCHIDRLVQDGVTSYEIDYVKNNQRESLSVGADGKRIE